jgi:outer membrane protein assembly factor BamD
VADARQRMIFLRNRLADFEYHVAEYYMRRGAYVGRSTAPSTASRTTTARRRAGSMKILIDAYRKLNMPDLAANAERSTS